MSTEKRRRSCHLNRLKVEQAVPPPCQAQVARPDDHQDDDDDDGVDGGDGSLEDDN